jgi:hypothetical protein
MKTASIDQKHFKDFTLSSMPTPAKALATCIIVALSIGMVGALGQIIVHDIIPTFFSKTMSGMDQASGMHHDDSSDDKIVSSEGRRGDLFADLPTVEKTDDKPFYKGEQFVWTLKWTHIHLFGMSMIFIFLGAVTIWLDIRSTVRTWLVVLPFIGVLVDILAMWLKAFVSPVFFWLHIPGGGLFAIVFGYVSLRALWEMWFKSDI